MRIVLRRQWLAVTVILGVSMVLGGVQSEYPWIDGPLNGLVAGVLLFVLLRLGLVALISAMLLGSAMFAVPLTTDLSVWYAWPSLLLLGLVFAFYACAFYISLAGRSIVRGSILPE